MGLICPVCGYDALFAPAWQDENPSDDICPSCGIQFGYYDAAGGDASGRERIYEAWRERWVADGMIWHSTAIRSPPDDWNPEAQLRRVTRG